MVCRSDTYLIMRNNTFLIHIRIKLSGPINFNVIAFLQLSASKLKKRTNRCDLHFELNTYNKLLFGSQNDKCCFISGHRSEAGTGSNIWFYIGYIRAKILF